MVKFLFQILYSMRWVMLIFCFGLAISLCGFAVVFVTKLFQFLLVIPNIDEFEAVLKMLRLIDYALVAGLVVMVMLSTFSSFVENQDDLVSPAWLSSISFGALKIKLISTIAAIGAITLLEHLFAEGTMISNNVLLSLAIELVLLAVMLGFSFVDWLASKRSD